MAESPTKRMSMSPTKRMASENSSLQGQLDGSSESPSKKKCLGLDVVPVNGGAEQDGEIAGAHDSGQWSATVDRDGLMTDV